MSQLLNGAGGGQKRERNAVKTNPNTSLADALAQSNEGGTSVEFDPPRADIRAKPAELDLIGQIPDTDIRGFIADLAKQHGIEYVETGYSAIARAFTHLSDKDIEPGRPDETEKLVIALVQAKVIDGRTMVELLGRYFDLQDREKAEISQLKGVVEKPAAPVSIEKMNEAIVKEGSSSAKALKSRE